MGKPEFVVEPEIRTGVVVLTVSGDLDVATSDELFDVAVSAIERGDDGARLVLDLSDIEFADSTGLTALVRCCRLTPGRLPVLLGASPAVLGPMRTTGLDALFEIRSTYEITEPHVIDLPPPPPETDGENGDQ